MIIDARLVPAGTVLETAVCIIGAGAAGITLAREFVGSGFETLLLESGGMEFARDTQDLYQGTNVGRPFQDLTACRLRFFGGSTNHWGGWCAPYDAVDFEPGFPYHNWPFDRAHLDPWYRRAQEVCQIGPFEYAPAQWGIADGRLTPPFNGPIFVCKIVQQSQTRFGPVYEPELRRADKVKVYLQANALGFVVGDHEGEVGELAVGTLSGVSFAVRARIFVIAAGGIENARLLLSGKLGGNGLGNEHDLVGRYFMTNLIYYGGTIAVSNPYVDIDAFTGENAHPYGGFRRKYEYLSQVGLSAESMRDLHLPSVKFFWRYQFVQPAQKRMDALDRALLNDLSRVIRNLDDIAEFAARKIPFGRAPLQSLDLIWTSAQLPNPASRVLLGTERDALGLRRVVIDWQVMAEDKRKAIAAHRLLGAEVGRTGFGRFRSALNDDDTTWPPGFYGDAHHMGTTRMHGDPTLGVVDQNCRVHSLANLYVAGSSVFPTSSAINPTLTIVALALRLADHIKKRLA
jgi:choline dehydrogenase-like flavoprotein